MKTSAPTRSLMGRFHANYGSKRSSALLIVLGCLVLISVLIVAFFYAVTAERQSAQFYANTSSVKLLADSTISLVEGQIKDATRGINSSGSTLAWASQPGMIRDYNTSGQADSYYKLYSATNMVGTGAYDPTKSDVPPSTWATSPAVYSDLNDPVSIGGANTYPIADPQATNTVKGFSISSTVPATSTSHDTLPMPVRWLYVLQQGQVIAPDPGSTGNKATFTQSAIQPGPTNAIAGRIAFWTDDDTCKVNINTAAGDAWVDASSTNTPPSFGNSGNPGAFWDTPRVWDNFETNLASFQPANGEYQRYPGHPAQTYLSAVFPTILTTPASIFSIVPRVSSGGSLSGTTYPGTSMLSADDSDRLYSSVDELLLSATNMTTATPPTRIVNSPFTKANIEQARFFLTAASRAPEVNLYNEPRVVIWPVNSVNDTAHRTAYDSLIAYCGTLNGNVYYFQRSNPKSPTIDLPTAAATAGLGRNRSLITYLRNLTSQPVPAFSTNGESFYSKYSAPLGSNNGLDRDEILQEIFDYIRTTNTQDQTVTTPFTPYGWGAAYEGQVVPTIDTANDSLTPLRGVGHMPVITEASLVFIGTGQTLGTNSTVYPSTATPPATGNTRVQAAFLVKMFDPAPGYAPYYPTFNMTATGLDSMSWSSGTTTSSVGFSASTTSTVTAPGSAWGYVGEWGVSQMASGTPKPYLSVIGTGTLDCTTGGTFSITKTDVTITIPDLLGGSTPLQTYKIEFPASTFPVPQLAPFVNDPTGTNGTTIYSTDFRSFANRFASNNSGLLQTYICTTDVVRSVAMITDPRLAATLTTVPQSYFAPVVGYDTVTIPRAHGIIQWVNGSHRAYPGAVLGKLAGGTVYTGGYPGASPSYNPSMTANTGASDFFWSTNAVSGSVVPPAGVQPQAYGTTAAPWAGIAKGLAFFDPNVFALTNGYAAGPNGVYQPGSTTVPGDWDNGDGNEKDGAYINKADEGAIPYNKTGLQLPYYGAGYSYANTTGSIIVAQGANFSPNRQMPSAGMFGSLPTGVIAQRPWQTLLFRPSPDGNVLPSENPGHIGAQSPQDHLMLDLFNMPIVEPYAISDPFSTAGKVNMNYQIVPFTYITRSTAVQAVLRSEQLLVVPGTGPASSFGTGYKGSGSFNYRDYIDLNQTLIGFNNMFSTGTTDGTGTTPDIFRSASQICNIWLVPAGLSPALTYATTAAYWLSTTANKGGILTGDNSRERPYANIYPRLTTKSNTYTVHMRVQTLKAVKSADPTFSTWVEGSDVITGEYRGSATLERYLDTSDTTIPDYATVSQPLTAGQAIDNFYKFRVVETKQFTP